MQAILDLRKLVRNPFPPLLTSYLLISVLLFCIPLAVHIFHFSSFMTVGRTQSVLFIGVVSALVWFLMYWLFTGSAAYGVYEETVEARDFEADQVLEPVNLLLAVIPSAVLVYGYLFYTARYLGFPGQYTNFDLAVILIGASPGLYIVTGVVKQTKSFIQKLLFLFSRSTPVQFHKPIDSEYSVRVIDSNNFEAYSISTIFGSYIFLADELIEVFQPKEIQAIVYHEESHIEHGDSLLAFIIPFLCVIAVTPQGVLFESLNFHIREIRADSEAASREEGDLESVLIRVRNYKHEKFLEENTLMAPGIQPADADNRSFFALFFGAHALQGSHLPSAERINRLRLDTP